MIKRLIEDDVKFYWSSFAIETPSIYCFDEASITLRGSAKASEANHFDQWVHTKASTIQVQGAILTIDKKCTVIIHSLDEAGCVNAENGAATLSLKSNPGIMAGIAAGGVAVLSIITVIVIVYYVRRKASRKFTIQSVDMIT